MRHFLKPTLWKIILFIVFFAISYFVVSVYWSFIGLRICPLMLPVMDPPKPQPFTYSEFFQQIPNAITGNYPQCSAYTYSESLQAAIAVVYNVELYGSLIFGAVLSYVLACGILYQFTKPKSKNIQKKHQ